MSEAAATHASNSDAASSGIVKGNGLTQQCVTAAGVLAEGGVQVLEVFDTASGRLIRQLHARLTDLPGELALLEAGHEIRWEGGRLWRATGVDNGFVLQFSGLGQWGQKLCTQAV